ncbi:uncharacterized protein Z520_10978 [Fonsecaea multimorphosa CBS 102226]|uniref:Uncharacterized protein n=1 Tax=Fonsecaea multimorphosa CBS 102226 TaxID=1442371 RepID=A0A0D2GUW9_9EURO|nr:uncharacterized protein Z520_10978 [Fonsecaea multimorphosa CBS 102226]KIX93335.1 hypothetical protein Z520_10978 [Fonsecaea multimorphosa CBS 102226]OAL18572.1 hypothetical protein AYO22_10549 [Fonsecaea multimorphosa]
MKFTSTTAAAVLAFTLAQVGALPSPQANDGSVAASQSPPADTPIYYVEDADVEKRDSQGQIHGSHSGEGHGEHKWKGMGKGQHGPMPGEDDDSDSVDLSPLFDHPDPEVQQIARRAIQATKFHWWQQQGDTGKFMNIVVGNPDVRPLANVKEQDLEPKEFKKRDPDAATATAGAPGASHTQHASGKWMGMDHFDEQGKRPQVTGASAQWKQWGQNRGKGPMADDEA